MNNKFNTTESLLAVPIRDDEIFELLERLAATEEMFKTPVSTIRDVAELTDASPNLIARLLGEMRGTSEFETLVSTVDGYGQRISKIEKRLETPAQSGRLGTDATLEPNAFADWIVRVGTKMAGYFDRIGLRIDVPLLMTRLLVLAIFFVMFLAFWIFNALLKWIA